jgi:hypothetical protein
MSYRRHISGSGILEKTLYKIPYEFHIPGYQFCGPNTKLEERLRRGDVGINGLDMACKDHDIAYSQNKDLKLRHDADRILAKKALERFHSKNASLGEKAAALGVVGAMKAKIKFGMGISTRKVGCVKVLNQCEKSLEKTKTTIEDCLKKISEFKTNDASEKKYRRKQQKKPPVNRKRKEGIAPAVENMMIDNNLEDEIVTNPISKSSFKRKLEFDPFEDNNKKPKFDNQIKLKPFKRKQQNKRKLDIETDDVADGDIITKKLKIT